MKSTLKNMVTVLLSITLLASLGVGAVNWLTLEPIARVQANAEREALARVVPASGGFASKGASDNGYGGRVELIVGFHPDTTIYHIEVLTQTETPGLGTVMTEEENLLLRSFRRRNPGEMKLSVRKDGGDVDALTGATVSSRAYIEAVGDAYNRLSKMEGSEEQVEQDIEVHSGATKTHNDE